MKATVVVPIAKERSFLGGGTFHEQYYVEEGLVHVALSVSVRAPRRRRNLPAIGA